MAQCLKGGQEEGGRNDFDEHQDKNEANKALEAQNHNNQGITTRVFVDNNFLNFCWRGASDGVPPVKSSELKTSIFSVKTPMA
jgi:hypothetical protein